MKQNMDVVLASNSPRRKELLQMLGLSFQTCAAKCEEKTTEILPKNIVCELSRQKARWVSKYMNTKAAFIGADTIVSIDNKVLGKPKNAEEAREFLSLLSGRKHEVFTGVTIIINKEETSEITFSKVSTVQFQDMTQKEIDDYISTGEPMDKAGAYAVQGIGARYIQCISGDYFTIVGLPMNQLYNILLKEDVISV